MARAAGILLHITSLPSPYGVGTLGREACRFLDFLERCGVKVWQILPWGPTGYGDSPYQSFSTFAGNPYLIDLEELVEEGLLEKEALAAIDWGEDPGRVDYEKLFAHRFAVLEEAFSQGFDPSEEGYRSFCQEQAHWLPDYALFMSIKEQYSQRPWWEWPRPLRLRDAAGLADFAQEHRGRIAFWQFVQYLFYRQWREMRAYAAARGVKILGDLPIYVARDSADVWARPELFLLDGEGFPTEVAGVPPDGFSADGQLWGNPLYRWDVLEAEGFAWWIRRVQGAYAFCDTLRMDHFRGFEAYYSIPAGNATAAGGEWRPGPGLKLFQALQDALGELPIVAEDLGFLTPAVHRLLQETGFPGMKVLQFAFEPWGDSIYLPHKYTSDCVVYTGTHDNDTSTSFLQGGGPQAAFCREYLGAGEEAGSWALIRAAWQSAGDLAIAPMQDFLALGREARMNTPSTIGGNWQWRLLPGQLTDDLALRIRRLGKLYGRDEGKTEDWK